MTPEQEASYEKHLESMPATPDWILGLRKDTLYKGPLEKWAKEKTQAAIPVVKPSTSAHAIMSHLCGDTPDQFAAVVGQLLTPEIQDKSLIPRVPTATLHVPKHITGSLRHVNTTDPFLQSARITPNHEFAIVPRRTADLPLNEHKLSVEQLVNAAIVAFHLEQHRLPHKITIAAIRYLRYRISIDTYDPNIFYYDDIPIPITSAPIGDFGIDEVWLD